ncbi:uncharacterized protein LOC133812299 [Humulus lupulus]|uniref:uncharacterized protein LOC133812299 n=1 Tax=Humulus lupulus TaxID=3486 RepID=UPI002B414F84|nr:uncharacterized protein LOC133812299 [Humulus lupulus]
MRAFIKSQDERAWKSILLGWTPPIEKYNKGNSKVKSELEWSIEDEKLYGYNNKALHAIFNGVGEDFIKLISSCESTKEAWKILQTQFEGTVDLSDIANEFLALGEKLDESVLVRKIVRVIPDRFDTKFLAMEEAKDFGKMKVEELIGSLRAFKLNQQIKKKGKPNPSIEKSKGIAFKVSKKDVSDDEMTLLTRNFQKFLKKVGNKKNFSKTPKGFNVTWSDDDSESSEEDNEKEIDSDSDSDESELNEESLAESYKVIYGKWLQVYTENRSLVIMNKEWSHNIKDLEEKNKCSEFESCSKNSEIVFLTKELDKLKRNIKMLNPGSNIFEEVQNSGQQSHAGLGFVETQSKMNTKFVKSKNMSSGYSDSTLQGSVFTAERSVSTEMK